MKFNKWTLGLAAVGVVSLASVAKAEETMSMVKTAVSGTTISGYVDTSVEWAISPSHTTLGGGYSYGPFAVGIPFREGKQDGFNLNAVGVTIEKPLDETPWASGYKVQLVFGPDGESLLGHYDMPIKQAYVTLRVPVGNGIELKIGQFDTIIGYEVFEAGNNPNFTRSWGWALEPTEHTGILATYHINDNIAVSAGVANTLSAGINTGDRYSNDAWDKTGLASITLTAPQSWGAMAGASFSSGIVYGMDEGLGDNRVNIYAGLTIPTPITGLAFGAAFDYTTACFDGEAYSYDHTFQYDGNNSVEAYTFALYGTWQATEKLSLNLRGEYLRGDLNSSYDYYDYYGGDSYVYGHESDRLEADIFSLTATLQYNLWANVISRLELRYDTVCSEDRYSYDDEFGSGSGSYNYPNIDQLSLYLNIIYKF